MTEPVTAVILARSGEPDRLRTMIVWSVAAHVCVIGAILFVRAGQMVAQPRTVMKVSLGGAPGPRAGGLTQMGGRQVQAPPPKLPIKREEAPPPPARPTMTLPDPRKPIRPRPQQQQSTETSRPRPPVAEEPQAGTARAETGARGQGFGLSSGGGGSKGVELDVSSFCCPEYLEQMIALIQRNWERNHSVVGSTVIKFTIARDGTIHSVLMERSSGFLGLDNAANRAVILTQRLPPLPALFSNPTLTVKLTFEYQR